MKYTDIESLQKVIDLINDANTILNEPAYSIPEESMHYQYVRAKLDAGLVVGGILGMLYGLGSIITSPTLSLSNFLNIELIVGSILLLKYSINSSNSYKNRKLNKEKEKLFFEAIMKKEAILQEIREDNSDQGRIDFLKNLDVLLEESIDNLRSDLGIDF